MTPRIHLPLALAAGAEIELPEAASRHVQVLRMQPGDAVRVFDGAGGEWDATVRRIGRRQVDVQIGPPLAGRGPELARRVTLAIGVPANERMDALVEKATELGVAAIQPLLCERSVLRLKGERAEARRERWAAIAAAASEQCGRRVVPRVEVQCPLADWLERLDDPAATSPTATPDTPAAATPIASEPARGGGRWLLGFGPDALAPPARLASLAADAALVVLSGPEGGLSAAEERLAGARGFARVGLGARVLRADTAPLAVLAWIGIDALAGGAG
ncbi:16S rRNA (uracil(1498)-N(3))-methyltransferase [Piscinibacter koreensis]|uniref:Ribosomal RNA small subunit methyltransferase E n=1 Tax=Piscinibacter koreensis TaxID=2742824 RepID=A0A7Y6TV05_9BURK|nr:16S rRNA (uracil(1498)-N(3))-methyltransferase [Schlegelella koreensis]NUZ04565.1 16S rRNA (uracil(1498)-N(3))-methyltransferase [Schlegelella koreensis]